MQGKRISGAPVINDSLFVASVTPPSTAPLTLTGAVPALPTRATVTFGGDSGKTITLTGTDERGLPQSVVVTSTGAAIITTAEYWSSITSAVPSATFASTVKIGVSGLMCTNWISHDHRRNPFSVAIQVFLSTGAAMTYSVQHTVNTVQSKTLIPRVLSHDLMTALTAGDDGNYAFAIRASRLVITAFTSGTFEYETRQAG